MRFCRYCPEREKIESRVSREKALSYDRILRWEKEEFQKNILFLEAEISLLKMQLEKLGKQSDNCDK